ncbi:hypothetical protein MKW98_029706 [Papaver atlanticum]|uniref:Uncharacterized protein n=1 Tax=Papaver atlanticum TaxID=357466 RepID=A0AAD4T3U7_9MAGN|nr:hypothetical protein MKW98_029706 [Papaver atlanticum]
MPQFRRHGRKNSPKNETKLKCPEMLYITEGACLSKNEMGSMDINFCVSVIGSKGKGQGKYKDIYLMDCKAGTSGTMFMGMIKGRLVDEQGMDPKNYLFLFNDIDGDAGDICDDDDMFISFWEKGDGGEHNIVQLHVCIVTTAVPWGFPDKNGGVSGVGGLTNVASPVPKKRVTKKVEIRKSPRLLEKQRNKLNQTEIRPTKLNFVDEEDDQLKTKLIWCAVDKEVGDGQDEDYSGCINDGEVVTANEVASIPAYEVTEEEETRWEEDYGKYVVEPERLSMVNEDIPEVEPGVICSGMTFGKIENLRRHIRHDCEKEAKGVMDYSQGDYLISKMDVGTSVDKADDIINKIIRPDLNIQIPYWVANDARNLVLAKFHGDFEKSYSKVPQLVTAATTLNPNSIGHFSWAEEGADNRFESMALSYGAQIQGFEDGCRLLIGASLLNFVSKGFKGPELTSLLWKDPKAYKRHHWEGHMKEMLELNEEAHRYLMKQDPKSRARSWFPHDVAYNGNYDNSALFPLNPTWSKYCSKYYTGFL